MYISWLQDALAMEKDIVQYLESQVDGAEKFPDVRSQIQKHLDETREHVSKLEGCLKQNGEEPSTAKGWLGQAMGTLKGAGTAMADDKIMKHSLADYATEHMEIAAYTTLITAAEMVGDTESVPVYESILEEEKEMALWLEDNLETLTEQFLEMHHAENS